MAKDEVTIVSAQIPVRTDPTRFRTAHPQWRDAAPQPQHDLGGRGPLGSPSQAA